MMMNGTVRMMTLTDTRKDIERLQEAGKVIVIEGKGKNRTRILE